MTENNCGASPSELESKIIRQVEYYFGDINLARDKFLQAEIQTEQGWVSLETMLKFNRLKQLTGEEDVVVEALRKSASGLMEVSEDGKKIRRSPARPLPEYTQERKNNLKWRSIYAKGFPSDTPLDDLMTYFNQFGPTEHIQMRRDKKHDFKGSCMVIYSNSENAKTFVDGDPIKFNGQELVARMFKHDYFEMKNNEKKQENRAKQETIEKQDMEKEEDERDDDEFIKSRMTTGAILFVSGLESSTTREAIKNEFVQYGHTVSWVDFNTGDTEGRLRFDTQDGAKTALEKVKEANDGKVVILAKEVEAKVLEGEEELDHWRKLYAHQKDRKDKRRKRDAQGGGRNARGGGRRGGHRGGRRGGDRSKPADSDADSDNESGEPPVKKVKCEEN